MGAAWTLVDVGVTDAASLAAAVDGGASGGVLRLLDASFVEIGAIPLEDTAFTLTGGEYAVNGTPLQVTHTGLAGRVANCDLTDSAGTILARGPVDVSDDSVLSIDRLYIEPGDVITVRDLSFADSGGAVVGSGAASVFTSGDRNVNLHLKHSYLAGVCDFTAASGSRIAVASCESGRVCVINALEPRNISLDGFSAVLDPPPQAIDSTDTYLFALCQGRGARRLVVLTNTATPVVVSAIDLHTYGDDSAAWVAVNEAAGVVAVPTGRGVVALYDLSTLALRQQTYFGLVRTGSAVWKRFALAERPIEGTKENRRFYLYVKRLGSEQAAVLELSQTLESDVLELENFRSSGFVELPGSRWSSKLLTGTEAILQSGAVNGRGPVIPIFEGVRPVSDGSYVAVWGYRNDSEVVIYQPRRDTGLTRNHLTGLGASDQLILPEVFYPGRIRRAVVLNIGGTATTWELQTQSGGGSAPLDYAQASVDVEVDDQALYAVAIGAGLVRKYTLSDPVTAAFSTRTDVGADAPDLLDVSLSFDGSEAIPHTISPNSDLSGVTRWWARNAGIRIEGGTLTLHGFAGIAAKYAPAALAKEAARGVLFSLPSGSVSNFDIVYQDPSVAQDGEQMGWEIGNSGDGAIIALSAESYEEGGNASVGRVHMFLGRSDGSAAPVGVVTPSDAGLTPSAGLQFSRFTEVSNDGSLMFVGAKGGDSIAVFSIDESGGATLKNTLTWPEYSALPALERAHEARVSKDGKVLLLSAGDRFFGGGSTVPGTVHVLYSEDEWATFEVRQVFSRSDADTTPDGFTTLDCDEECNTLAIGAWRKDKVYVYRTSDRWLTFIEYMLPVPAEVTSGTNFGITMACSSDGFRIVAGAPSADWDQGFGAKTNNGLAVLYTWDIATGAYVFDRILAPDDELADGDRFGAAVRFNAPGNRLSVVASGAPRQYLFGIHDDEIAEIARLDDAFIGGSADTRWLFDRDVLIVANKDEDNSPLTAVGAFRLIDFPEEP